MFNRGRPPLVLFVVLRVFPFRLFLFFSFSLRSAWFVYDLVSFHNLSNARGPTTQTSHIPHTLYYGRGSSCLPSLHSPSTRQQQKKTCIVILRTNYKYFCEHRCY